MNTSMQKLARLPVVLAFASLSACVALEVEPNERAAVVYITDFGLRDGAVSAMKGVARGVDSELVLEDLSHAIEPFDIWEASYRLRQTASYWPRGTVFVCVIDPGVGTERRSIVARTRAGYLFVTPDNGTLTLLDEHDPIVDVREISAAHRVFGSERSATFHGRDVYSLTGALLASGQLSFDAVGAILEPGMLVRLDYPRPSVERGASGDWITRGMIPVLDPNFGNVWTNIGTENLFAELESGTLLQVEIARADEAIYLGEMPYVKSFGEVPIGEPLAYSNSLGELALALNQGSFAEQHRISAGLPWTVTVRLAGK